MCLKKEQDVVVEYTDITGKDIHICHAVSRAYFHHNIDFQEVRLVQRFIEANLGDTGIFSMHFGYPTYSEIDDETFNKLQLHKKEWVLNWVEQLRSN